MHCGRDRSHSRPAFPHGVTSQSRRATCQCGQPQMRLCCCSLTWASCCFNISATSGNAQGRHGRLRARSTEPSGTS
eukprot:6684583-Lingulodinium_polyedra.AAC.1